MDPPRELSGYGRVYIWTVTAVGLYVIGVSAAELVLRTPPWQWFLLAALTLVSGSATVKLPAIPASISISETFVFTAVLLYGTAAGTVIVALDGLVISFWIAKRYRELHRTLFNASAPALSAWCSAHLFFIAAGTGPLLVEPTSVDRILPALILFATAYFGLNSWLITFAIVAETRLKPLRVWRDNFVWLSLNYFCGASVAFLLVTHNVDVRYIGVIVPLLLVLYFTFKISMDRVDDANKHVEKVDRLYLSTIETLAMAIDAKDQITHGHIRRVQAFAVGLARSVGVTDDALIKAVEAAALLHDTGKLAVPEHILNKPGKLTAAEFEKMKLHASVGADILSAIDFPYPVVPIVRHHHEHWDGNGYPDGLRGTDIPIGARILAIVDCFDALTSDRPYRPRLSDDEALRIISERRGTMYDPLIVDTFVRVHNEIAPAQIPRVDLSDAQNNPPSSSQRSFAPVATPRLHGIAASADETLTMCELVGALAGQVSVGAIGDIVADHLRRLVPFALCTLYSHNPSTDELEAIHVTGDGASAVRGLRIPLGQRLSGWVAVNRQTILNSDPTLDLGEASRALSPRLRNCVSTPLVSNDELVGVLTLYSSLTDGFNENHSRILETVALQVAYPLKCAVELERSSRPGTPLSARNIATSGTGTPVAKTASHTIGASVTFSAILVDVIGLHGITATYGRSAADAALHLVAEHARGALRPVDLLFQSGDTEFVAILNAADAKIASGIAERIREAIRQHPLMLHSGVHLTIDVTTTVSGGPSDGASLMELVAIARGRISPVSNHREDPIIH